MRTLFIYLILLIILGSPAAFATEDQNAIKNAKVSREDIRIITVLEILQLMDLMEEMDLVKDMDYLTIDGDQHESKD